MQSRSLGAYTDLSQLISYQHGARGLKMQRNQRALRQLSGPYRSLIRGRGLEFEDVRAYQPGDDIRLIDWRVTARVGITHTKQFREEREKPVIIACDQRQSLFFGSRFATKSVLAADLAAYLIWASLQKGDKVGGLIFNEQENCSIALRAQRKNALHYLNTLARFNQALNNETKNHAFSWQNLLTELKRIARPGSQVYFLSDFYGLTDDENALLFDLARHCDVYAFFCYDPLEQNLPTKGRFSFFNANKRMLFTGQQAKQWQTQFEQHRLVLKNQFGQCGIHFIPVSTEQAPLEVLQQYFGAQSR